MNVYTLYYTLKNTNGVQPSSSSSSGEITSSLPRSKLKKELISNKDQEFQNMVFLLIIEHALSTGSCTIEDILNGIYPYKLKVVKNKNKKEEIKFVFDNLPTTLQTIILRGIQYYSKNKKERKTNK
jgi:hypothetical protein